VLDDYSLDKLLGQGGFGTVHLAHHKETKKDYAIKFMDISSTRK
jgi:serine/threonine protein kinase